MNRAVTAPEEPSSTAMAGVAVVSLSENVEFNLTQVLPSLLQGIFTRNRFWTGMVARVHPDPLGVRFVSKLRRKYRSRRFLVRMLRTPALLLLDPEDIRQVLERSPDTYADPPSKRRGMSHFQPGAVTISRGDDWRDRRRFNDAVLAFGGTHPDAARYLRLVRAEVAALVSRPGSPLLRWTDFEKLFEAIALQVIFGIGARGDRELVWRLRRMLNESNRGIALRRSQHFEPFYRRLRTYLRAPEEGSLTAWCARVPSSARTKVERQIPHWMFATMETLAINATRALALIVSHPEVESAVGAEIQATTIDSVEGIASLNLLEGCLHEAMRLWPTTPLLVRETLADAMLSGIPVARGTQVLIPNGVNHRDSTRVPFTDQFTPERWTDPQIPYQFNHLSNGPQVCAGKELLLFLGKATLASLLATTRYRLERPFLAPTRPLPYAFDHFRIKLRRQP